MTCEKCKGTGEIEKTVYRGDEGMEIEMDVMVVCPDCEGKGEIN
jgi:DnaJ-class molecular chaperone